MEMTLRGSLQRLSASSLASASAASHWSPSAWSPSQDSGVTPNSSPSPTRRFRPAVSAVRWPPLAPLKRKGGVESDGPPKKLFVAGVTEPSHRSSYTLSVSPPSDDSPPLSAPQSPSFTSFSPHQHQPRPLNIQTPNPLPPVSPPPLDTHWMGKSADSRRTLQGFSMNRFGSNPKTRMFFFFSHMTQHRLNGPIRAGRLE